MARTQPSLLDLMLTPRHLTHEGQGAALESDPRGVFCASEMYSWVMFAMALDYADLSGTMPSVTQKLLKYQPKPHQL